jgi:GTP pyrophosphokinase
MESLKIDLFSDTVFVFTPKGDVIELPAGAIPIDFAYRVHSEVGHKCVGARVNGRMVPLDYQLNNGDIIEIMTSKQSGPSRDWLKMVKTTQSKTRIRHWFKREQREENAVRGRESLEREIKKQGSELVDWVRGDKLQEVARRFNFPAVEELYAAVGVGTLSSLQVVGKLKDDFQKERKATLGEQEEVSSILEVRSRAAKDRSSNGVKVLGLDNMVVRFAHCCNPLPGDVIVGYITRGRGVSIHRNDCPNLNGYRRNEPERIIDVSWDVQSQPGYQVEVEVKALDRSRLTTDVMNTIADSRIPINSVYARSNKQKLATINLTLEITNVDHLQSILQKIKRVDGVLEVRRVLPSQVVE